jgi:hypothetical protein
MKSTMPVLLQNALEVFFRHTRTCFPDNIMVVSKQHSLQERSSIMRMTKKDIMTLSACGGITMLGLILPSQTPQTIISNHIAKLQLH